MKSLKKSKSWQLLGLVLIYFLFSGCENKLLKYESDWLVEEFKIKGVDSIELLGLRNFVISVKYKEASPPSFHDGPDLDSRVNDFNIIIFKQNSLRYIEISGDCRLCQTYKMTCLDRNCCNLVLENDSIHFKLKYNGELPFGKSRKCD